MATALQKIEAEPQQYPPFPVGLSQAAQATVIGGQRVGALWKRIEDHVAHRWSARNVTWIIEGAGEWLPSLTPIVAITAIEQWQTSAWVPVAVSPTPMGGLYFPTDCHYRVSANVGAGPTPQDADEAFRRLAEYLAGIRGNPSEISSRRSVGDVTNSVRTEPDFMGMAMHKSGAADLLRNYRSVV